MPENKLEFKTVCPLPVVNNFTESVTVQHENGKRNLCLPKVLYEQIASLIFAIIAEAPNRKVTLQYLIELAEPSMPKTFQGDAMWYLLQVKQDLSMRRQLQVTRDSKRVQFIELPKETFCRSWVSPAGVAQ